MSDERGSLWNQLLPYDTARDASVWLSDIKTGFATGILSQSLGLSCMKPVNSLLDYLDLKYPLTLEERVWFARILYDLVCNTEVDLFCIDTFANACSKLIKNESKLPADVLNLPWKPLAILIQRLMNPRKKDNSPQAAVKTLQGCIGLAAKARRFFSPDDTKDILQEYLPEMRLRDMTKFLMNATLIGLLIPIHTPPPVLASSQSTGGKQKREFYWINSLFSIWANISNQVAFDVVLLELFANMAEVHVTQPTLLPWTKEQISNIFCIGMNHLNLPVGKNQKTNEPVIPGLNERGRGSNFNAANIFGQKLDSQVKYFAKFIAYAIFSDENLPQGSGATTTLDQLECMMRAVEGYAHPSNYGSWSMPLSQLIKHLCSTFLKRLRQENERDTPPLFRLSKETITRFVEAVKPVVFLLMFSKNPASVYFANQALACLAWIDPDIILTKLLDYVYPALETLTESHRTVSCISALEMVAPALFNTSHYPAGGKHLIPLLHLTLPGIDINDTKKTIATINFIHTAVCFVPIFDASTIMSDGDDDDMEARRLSTVEFETWIIEYVNLVLSFFENLPESFAVEGQSKSVEGMAINFILAASRTVFAQLSPDLNALVLDKLVKYASSTVVPSATKPFAELCSYISFCSPALRLSKFLPVLERGIVDELEHGAASKQVHSVTANPHGYASMSDATLHWYQAILWAIVKQSGPSLLAFRDQLIGLIRVTWEKCQSYVGYKWTAKLLRNIVYSLLETYPLDPRSHPTSDWESDSFSTTSYKRWGQTLDLKDTEIQWHSPSQQEIEYAVELLEIFGKACSSNLSSTEPHVVQKSLVMLRNLLYASAGILKPRQSVSHNDETDDLKHFVYKYQKRPLEGGYPLSDVTHPLYQRLDTMRQNFADAALQLTISIEEHRADDVFAFRNAIKCIHVFLNFGGTSGTQYDRMRKGLRHLQYGFRLYDGQKLDYCRPLTVLCAQVLHLNRLKQNISLQPVTAQVRLLTKKLVDLSLSKYAEVRKLAQNRLSDTFRTFTSLRIEMYQSILDPALFSSTFDESVSHRLKGTLYLLRNKSLLYLPLGSWKFAEMFIRNLVTVNCNDNVKLVNVVRALYVEFSMSFAGIPFELKSPLTALELAKSHADTARVEQVTQIELERQSISRASYRSLLSDLINTVANPETHWSTTSMALNFLERLLDKNESIPSGLVSCVAMHMIHDHPTLRNMAISLSTRILIVMKERGGSKSRNLKRIVNTVHVPHLTDSIGDYVDDSSGEWLVMPLSVKTYTKPDKILGLSPSFSDPSNPGLEQEWATIVKQEEFWKTLLRFASQESSNKTESFSYTIFLFYKRVFEYYESSLIQFVKPIMESLVHETVPPSKQRAVAELFAGILRGSKHWCEQDLYDLYGWILPLFEEAVTKAPSDCFKFWIQALDLAVSNRDPRRYSKLIYSILSLDINPNSESFLGETKKIELVQTIVSSFSSRLGSSIDKLLNQLPSLISSPYHEIRLVVGLLWVELIDIHHTPRSLSFEDYISQSNTSTSLLQSPSELMLSVFNELSVKSSTHNATAETFLVWFSEVVQRSRTTAVYPYVVSSLNESLRMIEHTTPELQLTANRTLKAYTHFIHHASIIPVVLNDVLSSLQDESVIWHRKVRILALLQTLFFRHLHLIEVGLVDNILNLCVTMLSNGQLEVRTAAATAISGILQCIAADKVVSIKTRMVKSFKLTKRTQIVNRHGAVLGLCSLIQAFPYTILPWTPSVLVLLTQCSTDPSPISISVQKTFAEFKRTHQDTWEQDRLLFSEDDLLALSDVFMSPSYYA